MNKVKSKKSEDFDLKGCEALCAAVVERAVMDYTKALRVLKKNPKNVDALATVGECDLFFRKYSRVWTSIDGNLIMEAIQKKVNSNRRGKRRGRRNAR